MTIIVYLIQNLVKSQQAKNCNKCKSVKSLKSVKSVTILKICGIRRIRIASIGRRPHASIAARRPSSRTPIDNNFSAVLFNSSSTKPKEDFPLLGTIKHPRIQFVYILYNTQHIKVPMSEYLRPNSTMA